MTELYPQLLGVKVKTQSIPQKAHALEAWSLMLALGRWEAVSEGGSVKGTGSGI